MERRQPRGVFMTARGPRDRLGDEICVSRSAGLLGGSTTRRMACCCVTYKPYIKVPRWLGDQVQGLD